MSRYLSVIVLTCCFATVLSAQTTDFKPDQKVEVREGDEWSAATVVKKEGRKVQIKYGDGTEEWVTADRVRMPGAKGADPKAADAKPADPKAADAKPDAKPEKEEKKVRTQWQVGQAVQVKWGGTWREAKINNKRVGDWYLVTYDNVASFQEWVEWYRIRKQGSKDDTLPHTQPNGGYRKGQDPPRADAGDAPGERKPFGKEDDKPDFDKPIADASTAGVKEVLPTFSGGWSVAPDPDATKHVTSEPIIIKSKSERMGSSYLLRNGTAAAFVAIDEFGRDVKSITVEKMDLNGGSASAVANANVKSRPVAISPGGKFLLGRSNEWGFGGSRRLDLWSLGGGDPAHVISFNPYGDRKDRNADITAAGFITDDLAWSRSTEGVLIVWEIAKAKAVWQMATGNGGSVTISPGGKYFYVLTGDEDLLCLDALTGKPLGIMTDARQASGGVSISPDGTTLVAASPGLLSIYDLQAGKVIAGDIGISPSVASGSGVTALGDGFALFGKSVLFDLNKKLPVWKYQINGDHFFALGGRCFTIIEDNNRKILVSQKLPHEAAKKGAAAANAGDMLLQPGAKVALDVSIAASPEETKAITDALSAQLTRNGMTIDPTGPVRVVVRTADGKTTTETWGTMGGAPWNRQQEQVNITEKITTLTIETGALVAWETKTVARPYGMVSAKQGQTIAQAVGEQNKFNTAFLKSVRLPQYLPKMIDATALSESRWQLSGIKETK